MKTLANWAIHSFPTVELDEAQMRANICNTSGPGGSNCPHQVEFGELSRIAFETLSALTLRGKKPFQPGKCEVCGCFLGIKVWAKGNLNEEGWKFPEYCWSK